MVEDGRFWIGPAVLAALWILESLAPFYPEFRQSQRARLRHDIKNLAFGIFNAVLLAILFAGLFRTVEIWSDETGFGLLHRFEAANWLETVAAFLMLDLWMYVWHRANHEIPFLWRFHRMHHSDPDMDASTGLRFHTGEIMLSALAQLVVLPVLGLSVLQVALYRAVFTPIVLFHHSNVSLPERWDRALTWAIVSPAMHRVHHSRLRVETDSNYGSVFPWWDRLLRSFRLRDTARTIRLGLDDFDAPEWQSVPGLLKTPLAPLSRWQNQAQNPSQEQQQSESTPNIKATEEPPEVEPKPHVYSSSTEPHS